MLKHFTDRLRNDVLLRIATLDGVQPAALTELNDAMGRVLAGAASSRKKTAMGGIRHAAEILGFRRSASGNGGHGQRPRVRPELAQKILDEMFVFENLMDIDDRGIQLLLRGSAVRSLIIALKGASPNCAILFKNMSQRAAEMLRETSNQGPGAAVRSRGRAEGNPQDRPPPRRRRADPARRRRRRRCFRPIAETHVR